MLRPPRLQATCACSTQRTTQPAAGDSTPMRRNSRWNGSFPKQAIGADTAAPHDFGSALGGFVPSVERKRHDGGVCVISKTAFTPPGNSQP